MEKIYLIVASVLLVSCAKQTDIRPLPIESYYAVDLQYGFCYEYKLVDKEKVLFQHVANHPLQRCDGVFGTMPRESSLLMSWLEETIAKAKKYANKYCNTPSPIYTN